MKRLAVLFILALGVLHAWEPKCKFCHTYIEVGAEVIYWKPSAPPFNYAIRRDAPLFRVGAIKPQYEWSFRINGTMSSMDRVNYTSMSYLQLFTSDKDHLSGAEVFVQAPRLDAATTNQTEFVNAELKFGYRTADILIGHDLLAGCDHNLFVFAGGRYSQVRRRELTFFNELQSQRRSLFEGVGPEIGMGAALQLGCGFSVTGEMSGMALIGAREVRAQAPYPIDPSGFLYSETDIKTPSQTLCIAGTRVRLGVSYTSHGNLCIDLIGELGFETHYYFQVVEKVDIIPPNNEIVSTTESAGFGGPYFALWVRF